jgi:GMP synthase PP-ATPase subunit
MSIKIDHREWASKLLLVLAVAVAACTPNPAEKSRGETFKQYETIVRWSQWDAAADFIAPEYLAENPITRLEMDRLRLFRVTAYTVRSTGVYDDGMTARQTVEIRMFNTRQAVERTILDQQEWRYHENVKRWLLHSGLPDPTQRY